MSSRFERNFATDFNRIKQIVCSGKSKFVVVTFTSQVRMRGYDGLGRMMTGVLAEIERQMANGGEFYVGVFQRHLDGTCHRVCYKENVY